MTLTRALCVTPVIILVLAFSTATQANLLVNGNFEDTTGWGAVGTDEAPEGWGDTARKNPAEIFSGTAAIGGSGTSAYLPSYPTSTEDLRRELCQVLDTATELDWSFEFDAAAVNSDNASQRTLHFYVALSSGSTMIFRVLGSSTSDFGALQMYNQKTSVYATVSGFENCFTYCYDVTTNALINHFAIDANFDSETPTWNLSVTDASGNVTSATDLDLTQFSSGAGGLKRVAFQTFLSYGDVLIDNVVVTDSSPVPEPSIIVLLFTCLASLAVVRKVRGKVVS